MVGPLDGSVLGQEMDGWLDTLADGLEDSVYVGAIDTSEAGASEGNSVGLMDGSTLGQEFEGLLDTVAEGSTDSVSVGETDTTELGESEGSTDSVSVGETDTTELGESEDANVGLLDGNMLGQESDGALDAPTDGSED